MDEHRLFGLDRYSSGAAPGMDGHLPSSSHRKKECPLIRAAAPERIEALGATTLLKRAANAEEIAEVVAFLASPRASYVTARSSPPMVVVLRSSAKDAVVGKERHDRIQIVAIERLEDALEGVDGYLAAVRHAFLITADVVRFPMRDEARGVPELPWRDRFLAQ